MALLPLASVDVALPKHFPWLSASSPVPVRLSVICDEFAMFADEVLEWAELTLASGLEDWPDDNWSDQ
jgi:mRNA interferase MazF